MTTERLNKLVNEPQHLVSAHEGGFSLPLPGTGEALVFYPVIVKSILSELHYSFSPETNFRGLLEAVCCIYRQRPWYHLFHLDSRELLNFIQDKNDDLIEGIMDDIRDVSDVCDSLASAIGKSLLQLPPGGYTGDFFRDLALTDERFSHALSTLFPNGEIRITLETFHPPVLGVSVNSSTGHETEIMNFLNESLPLILGTGQWKLVAQGYQSK